MERIRTSPKLNVGELTQLAKTWDILDDRRRVLRGRPLPGSLKPETVKGKRGRPGMYSGSQVSEIEKVESIESVETPPIISPVTFKEDTVEPTP